MKKIVTKVLMIAAAAGAVAACSEKPAENAMMARGISSPCRLTMRCNEPGHSVPVAIRASRGSGR